MDAGAGDLTAAAAHLSGSKLLICKELIARGGIASRRTLPRQLVETGKIEKITLSVALMSSWIVRRQDLGIRAITGYNFFHKDLQNYSKRSNSSVSQMSGITWRWLCRRARLSDATGCAGRRGTASFAG